MSILGSIMSKVFGHHDAPPTAPSQPATTTATNTGASSSGAAPPTVPSSPSAETGSGASTSTATPATTPSSTSGSPSAAGSVDVAAVLDGMEHHAGQKLDWRHSIVDLMKLLGMDSSLTARKTLAEELLYSGDTEDSATMNMWLHKEVMAKFAANGGKLPPDLAH